MQAFAMQYDDDMAAIAIEEAKVDAIHAQHIARYQAHHNNIVAQFQAITKYQKDLHALYIAHKATMPQLPKEAQVLEKHLVNQLVSTRQAIADMHKHAPVLPPRPPRDYTMREKELIKLRVLVCVRDIAGECPPVPMWAETVAHKFFSFYGPRILADKAATGNIEAFLLTLVKNEKHIMVAEYYYKMGTRLVDIPNKGYDLDALRKVYIRLGLKAMYKGFLQECTFFKGVANPRDYHLNYFLNKFYISKGEYFTLDKVHEALGKLKVYFKGFLKAIEEYEQAKLWMSIEVDDMWGYDEEMFFNYRAEICAHIKYNVPCNVMSKKYE